MPVYCLGISLSLLWIPKSPIYYLSPSPGHTAHRSQRPYLNLLLNLKSLNGLQLLLHFPVVLSWPHKSYADTSLTISDVFKRNRGCQKEKKKSRIGKKSLLKWKQEPRFEEVACTFISLTTPHRCLLPRCCARRWGGGDVRAGEWARVWPAGIRSWGLPC